MDAAKLRAWWWHRQGLDGSLEGRTAAQVLDRAGWSRSVGGVNPYLTLFARADLRREAVDAAVERTETYVAADLGDARSFSLDSPKSRAPRVDALRRAAKQP